MAPWTYDVIANHALDITPHSKMSIAREALRLCFQRLHLYGMAWNCAAHLAITKQIMAERGLDTSVIEWDLHQVRLYMDNIHTSIQAVLTPLGFEIGHCSEFCCLVVEDEWY